MAKRRLKRPRKLTVGRIKARALRGPNPDGSSTSRTKSNYRICARHLVSSIGNGKISRVDRSTLERYRDARMKAGSAPATVRQELKKIQAAWSWGREMGLCPARDLSRVRVSGIGVRNKRTPTVGEVARVLAVMDGWPHLAIYLLYSTAGRPVDVAYLRWRDVELELAQVTLRGKKKERQIPLDLEVVQALKTWGVGGPDDLVLGVSPKMVLGHLSSRYLAKACKTAGVHRFTPYGLRRCGEDRLARAGVDVAVYAAILGHSPAVALKHYRRATMDDCRAAMKRAALSHLPSGDVLPFAQGGRDR